MKRTVSDRRVQEMIDEMKLIRVSGKKKTPRINYVYGDLEIILREVIELRRKDRYVDACLL